MTKKQSEFVEYILELLEPMGGINSTRLFGGYAIRRNSLTFALIFDDEIYLKVDDSNIDDYKNMGSKPFTYQKKGKTIFISNWSIPIDILEDQTKFIEWAEKSYRVASNLVSQSKALSI